jgi:hypothetical protein
MMRSGLDLILFFMDEKAIIFKVFEKIEDAESTCIAYKLSD